jgi:uncharacterized protein with PhoU and TrkA domain
METANYVAELTVSSASNLIGKKPSDFVKETEKADVAIVGVIRDGRRLYGSAQNRKLAEGDTLVLEAVPEAIDEFRTAFKLDFADEKREENLKAGG